MTDGHGNPNTSSALAEVLAEALVALCVGETTVKTHVTTILSTLGPRDRIHAMVLAFD